MTTKEAKIKIATEFVHRYNEWLSDSNNSELTDREYGKKYGYGKSATEKKDTQANMLWFQAHIFSGRFLNGWEKEGFERNTIYNLHQEGFLAYDYNSSWEARQLNKSNFYYINQAKAKEIYKAYKNGFFNER